jgi:hypothetical protein
MTSFRTLNIAAMASIALALTACTGKTDKPDTAASDSAVAVSAETWAQHRRTADSIMKAAPEMAAVMKDLGARYDQSDATLETAVREEMKKTRDCYTNALRQYDGNLSMVFYMLTNFGGAGWDLVRVERSTNSSNAAGAVMTCLNLRAKAEWKLPVKGIKPGAHLTKFVFTPDSAVAWKNK